MADIAGRQVKLSTGRQTQTVNVCFEACPTMGSYEFKFRIADPAIFLTGEILAEYAFDDIAALRHFLVRHGAVEEEPGDREVPGVELLKVNAEFSEDVEDIIAQLDQHVDNFIEAFLEAPYTHRVEHSIHVDLFNRIAGIEAIAAEQITLSDEHSSPLVHKEWPEPTTIGNSTRRGSHDLALLPPCTPTIQQFCRGFIRPFAAFELGLNYEQDHFLKDVYTLHYAELPAAYVIHLARAEAHNQERVIEQVKLLIEAGHDGNNGWPKLAIGILRNDSAPYVKRVGD